MKKIFALFLSLSLALSLFGCGNAAPAEPTEAPEATQSEAEAKVLKLLVIGNSHSNDAFWQLYEVFKAQAPEQEVVVGILYYSGCDITQHVQFGKTRARVYDYYRNGSGTWEHLAETDMQYALQDQAWDIILLQPSRPAAEYEKETRDALAAIVAENVKEPYDLYLHKSWANPSDPELWSDTHDPVPPSGYWDSLIRIYGTVDPVNQTNMMNEQIKTKMLGDEMFTKFISTGAAIMHAHLVSGVPQVDLWRDYTHLTDYGRLIASYALYTQITGDSVTEVKVESIAANLRHRRAQVLGDMEVTPEMKQVILDAVKYAQENPWTTPGQS